MKHLFLSFILFAAAAIPSGAQQSRSRVITSFDGQWKFATGDYENVQEATFNDRSWRTLDLPNDWSIEGENLQDAPGAGNIGYFPSGIGWYRKTFDLPAFNPNKRVRIEFDGIYENSEVWLNGVYLGKRPYGYASFSYDIAPYLKKKGNIIAVRVDNSHQPNSRWYTGSGIYRHVRLVETLPVHFEKWGIFTYTKALGENEATLAVKATLVNERPGELTGTIVEHTLYTQEGTKVVSAQSTVSLKAGAHVDVDVEIKVPAPKVWSTDEPHLYRLDSRLYVDGREQDCEINTIGIRTIAYDVDKGFLLNGKPVKMKGVNLHHDAGPVGAAVPERVWERRIEILKSGGCNAIRTAHNPPAPEFLDLCDRHGMLVMDEAFDEWLAGKRTYSYKLYFAEWHMEDLKAMVLRDRNHPSVVMWSIGNEVPDQSTPQGPALAKEMIAFCHEADPTRLVTAGNDNIAADGHRATEAYLAAFENDIVGYNYPDRWHERRELLYSIDKALYPDRRVVGTETGGLGSRRGRMTPAQLVDVEQRWKYTLLHDYVTGDFMWTGIDYYGETFWPSRGAASGYIDNCGFRKDGFFFFKSIWTDEPVLHIASDWNRDGEEGKIIPIVCFTNCNEVELFVNGKSYGVKTFEFPRTGTSGGWNTYAPGKVFTSTADLHLQWDVEYQPGEIKAVGKKNGQEYTHHIVTTDKPHAIRLSVDRDEIRAIPSDVAHITVEIVDKNGHVVPYADNPVKFEIEGVADLIGVESGNFADLGSVKTSQRNAFRGKCLAIVQASRPGTIRLKAASEGLAGSEIRFIAFN